MQLLTQFWPTVARDGRLRAPEVARLLIQRAFVRDCAEEAGAAGRPEPRRAAGSGRGAIKAVHVALVAKFMSRHRRESSQCSWLALAARAALKVIGSFV